MLLLYTHTHTHLPQDMYVDRLTEEVQRAEEQVALYRAQCSAQSQDTQAVKEALSEAAMELEVHGGGVVPNTTIKCAPWNTHSTEVNANCSLSTIIRSYIHHPKSEWM